MNGDAHRNSTTMKAGYEPGTSGRRAKVSTAGIRFECPELLRRCAVLVDRILHGAEVRELPVEFPTKFELTINLKNARTLGLKVPTPILLRADEVIE